MGTTSAFAKAIAERRKDKHCCRVGEILAVIDDASRTDAIAALANTREPASEVAAALSAVAAGIGSDLSVSDKTVRNHRQLRHEAA